MSSILICRRITFARAVFLCTTTTDEFGNSQPSTAYELHCVDSNGTIVKEDPGLYAFLWIGVIALTGLMLAALLALTLAAPAGILITRWFKPEPMSDMTASANIEPE